MKSISPKLIAIVGLMVILITIMISDFTLSSYTFTQNVTISPYSTYSTTLGSSTLINIKFTNPLNVTYYGGPVFDLKTEKVASATAVVVANNYSYTQDIQEQEIVIPPYIAYEYMSMSIGILLLVVGIIASLLKKINKL